MQRLKSEQFRLVFRCFAFFALSEIGAPKSSAFGGSTVAHLFLTSERPEEIFKPNKENLRQNINFRKNVQAYRVAWLRTVR